MDEAEFWAKWGRPIKRRDGICPRCEKEPRAPRDSYCVRCRRTIQRNWMRANRPRYAQMTEEERAKSRCRAYTNVLVRRGKLAKKPCVTCGRTRFLEAHHADYTKPREVVWMCRRCHRQDHQEKKMPKQQKKVTNPESEGLFTVDGKKGTPEVGAIYLVVHSRKGSFQMRVTSVDGEWVKGTITDGRAKAALVDNEADEGEEVTIRASLCKLSRGAKLPDNEWDGKPIPMEKWGRDHASTLLYIESCCTDKGGKAGMDQMRSEPGRPRKGWQGERGLAPGGPPQQRYATRLKGGFEMFGHDDWDCAGDFVEAGLLIWHGTSLQPLFELTPLGWEMATNLRKQRAADTAPVEYRFEAGAL